MSLRPTWAGYYDESRFYVGGEVVVMRNRVYMAKEPSLGELGEIGQTKWAYLGWQENCKIDHYYHPEAIQFPLPSGDMSESTYVCSDCWKNCNYAAAFMGSEHSYLISELPG